MANNSTLPASALDASVSLFARVQDKTPRESPTLGSMLKRIKNGAYRATVEPLRDLLARGDIAGYKRGKSRLASFSPCCALSSRDRTLPWLEKLISTTRIVYFDLDDLDTLDALKTSLSGDPNVSFVFTSPSARGLKVGVLVGEMTGPEDYRCIWTAVLAGMKRRYPNVQFSEDRHVRFLHALCYVSHDPDLHVNASAVPFVVPPPAPKMPKSRPARPPMSGDDLYARVAAALGAIPNDDAPYHDWLTLG